MGLFNRRHTSRAQNPAGFAQILRAGAYQVGAGALAGLATLFFSTSILWGILALALLVGTGLLAGYLRQRDIPPARFDPASQEESRGARLVGELLKERQEQRQSQRLKVWKRGGLCALTLGGLGLILGLVTLVASPIFTGFHENGAATISILFDISIVLIQLYPKLVGRRSRR